MGAGITQIITMGTLLTIIIMDIGTEVRITGTHIGVIPTVTIPDRMYILGDAFFVEALGRLHTENANS
jgi:hypothetical protein